LICVKLVICENQYKMNTNEKISLLIRHADRDAIPEGSFGNEVLLNKKGIQNALSFGEKLSKNKLNKIFTSPVLRCVQTAQYISEGYGKAIKIIETKALGAPGLHIENEKTAGEFLLQHGLDAMYERFIQGQPIPGVPNFDQLNHKMTSFIKEHTQETGTTLFITHDMLIAFYHFSMSKKIYTKENWINYLSGLKFINL